MIYIIKDIEPETIALFDTIGTAQEEAAEAAYNEAETANNRIFWGMISQLHAGDIDAIRTETSKVIYTYTRSAQTAGAIQRTAWMTDTAGDLLPLSHCDIFAEDEHRQGHVEIYTPGIYETFIY